MSSKIQDLLRNFNTFCVGINSKDSSINAFLKSKLIQFENPSSQHSSSFSSTIDWKSKLIQAYSTIKNIDDQGRKMIIFCEQIVSQFQHIIKEKNFQLENLSNQLVLAKNNAQQTKNEIQKIKTEYEEELQRESTKTAQAIEKFQFKMFYIEQLEQKIADYEEQIQELKSAEYKKMLASIKEEEILSNQTQNLYKQNALLKFKLKQENSLKNQLSRHIKNLNEEIQNYALRQQKLQRMLQKASKSKVSKRKSLKEKQSQFPKNIKKNPNQTINLVQYKEDFSFKDSVQNDNNNQTIIIHNNAASFLSFESKSGIFNNQSNQLFTSRDVMQRDFLNLTDRDNSVISNNVGHLLRTKKNHPADKQNVSENTISVCEFENGIGNSKVSYKYQQVHKPSKVQNVSSKFKQQKYVNSPRGFGTQERRQQQNSRVSGTHQRGFVTQQKDSFLNKHRRIKSSFCGQNIQEFQEESDIQHFVANSQKFQQSINEENQTNKENDSNDLANQSSITLGGSQSVDINEIMINDEMIMSKRAQQFRDLSSLRIFEVKMANSIKVEKAVQSVNTVDIYYAFFSLTAQCVKLNSKHFNKVIAIYFNLDQEYKNVLQKTIPINKWYNYIKDQIQTSLKYSS